MKCCGIHMIMMSKNTWSVKIHRCNHDSKKASPFFFFFFSQSSVSKVEGFFSSVSLLIVVLLHFYCVSANFHIKNLRLVDTKPFGQGGPAMHEVSLTVTVARTKGQQTQAAWPL